MVWNLMENDDWKKRVTASREKAADIGAAAKEKDYAKIKATYLELVQMCNDCHLASVGEEDMTEVTPW